MPWICERSDDEIGWHELEQLMRETVAQARSPVVPHSAAVLLLAARHHADAFGVAGRLTEMLYRPAAEQPGRRPMSM